MSLRQTNLVSKLILDYNVAGHWSPEFCKDLEDLGTLVRWKDAPPGIGKPYTKMADGYTALLTNEYLLRVAKNNKPYTKSMDQLLASKDTAASIVEANGGVAADTSAEDPAIEMERRRKRKLRLIVNQYLDDYAVSYQIGCSHRQYVLHDVVSFIIKWEAEQFNQLHCFGLEPTSLMADENLVVTEEEIQDGVRDAVYYAWSWALKLMDFREKYVSVLADVPVVEFYDRRRDGEPVVGLPYSVTLLVRASDKRPFPFTGEQLG